MSWYPPYVPADELEEVEDRLRAAREKTSVQYDEYAEALETGEMDEAIQAKRNYQLAAHQRRQAEGEIVWAVLGHAIAHVADRVEPDDDAVTDQGQEFVQWAVGTDRLRSVRSRDRIELIVVRRSPTLPEIHAEYVETMLGMAETDISKARKRDRAMLERAGWTRQGRPSDDPIASRPCPKCGNTLVLRSANSDEVTLQVDFVDDDDVTREICPHCDADVFVQRSAN